MTGTWRLTDLEFVVLWEHSTSEFLPQPFSFLSRTERYDDYLREKRRTWEHLRERRDGALTDVVAAVVQPDVRVTVSSMDPGKPDDPRGRVRSTAVRCADRGYLIQQLPGETIWHSGGFDINECDPLTLGRTVATTLPPADPGRRSEVVLVDWARSEMDYTVGESEVFDAEDEEPQQPAVDFLRIPTTQVGRIEVAQGRSRFGPRGVSRHRMAWRDVVDDGRYAITAENPPVAVAADSRRMTELIDTLIARVIRAIKDERY